MLFCTYAKVKLYEIMRWKNWLITHPNVYFWNFFKLQMAFVGFH